MNLPTYKCLRCLHTWIPRKEGRPAECPKCKSPRWDRERVRPQKDEKK